MLGFRTRNIAATGMLGIAVVFLGAPSPCSAQALSATDAKRALTTLQLALDSRSIAGLAPLLDTAFHFGTISGQLATNVLEQIITKIPGTPTDVSVDSVRPEGPHQRVYATMTYPAEGGGVKRSPVTPLLTTTGRFIELGLGTVVRMDAGATTTQTSAPERATTPPSPVEPHVATDIGLRQQLERMIERDGRHRTAMAAIAL
jgi:hypothetical protein